MSEVVNTNSGAVRGVERDGVVAFKGIPYGGDTGREGRFRAPRAPRPWPNVRDCSDYGPSCPQITVEELTGHALPPEVEHMMGVLAQERVTGEGCLVLNVWTPSTTDHERRPVLVWLHGGGMSTGSASWPLYDFSNLARHNDVVSVGFNHRVGILGFLDLSEFDADLADSGNVGMLDIVAALEWVRDNIGAFGGDPSNLTIVGESGGGAKVTTLLAMPPARGLFGQSFAMSGALLAAQTHDEAAANTERVLDLLGCGADLEKLRALEAERLVEAEVALRGGPRSIVTPGAAFGPVLGPSLPQHPVDAVRAGSASEVSTVVGCTTDEMVAFLGTPELWSLDEKGLRERVRGMLGTRGEAVLDAYRALRPGESPASLFLVIASDYRMRIPHVRIAEAVVAGGGRPPYMYLFAWGGPSADGKVRAGHGSDMPFFFDNIDRAPLMGGPHAQPLVSAMSGALVALARTGDPNHDSLPEWPTYDLAGRATMRFDVEPAVDFDPGSAERQVWDRLDVDLVRLRG